MIALLLLLTAGLLLIVGSAELFTNGVEWLGQKLGLGEGVVGSLFAAVGTALPETLIPVVAVLFFKGREGVDVGIGAIAGAPYMLSTLTLALCGSAILLSARAGLRGPEFKINKTLLSRDLLFFLIAYVSAIGASFLPANPTVRFVAALAIVSIYPVYAYLTFKSETALGEEPDFLHLQRLFKFDSFGVWMPLLQTILGLIGITGGAFLFVDKMEALARGLGMPALILSLIVSPIATELPEKINSIMWARRGKDTLALGNITGALVFQACFPVAFGVAFTRWELTPAMLATAVIALVAAGVYRVLIERDRLRPAYLLAGGLVYFAMSGYLIYSNPPGMHAAP